MHMICVRFRTERQKTAREFVQEQFEINGKAALMLVYNPTCFFTAAGTNCRNSASELFIRSLLFFSICCR